MIKKFLLFFFLFALSSLSFAQEERILSFHSDITVHPDSSMTVCETIKGRTVAEAVFR